MSDDLVRRLKRAEGIGACLSGDAHHVKNLCSEAASAIEAKDAENKGLRGKLDMSINNSKLLLDAKNYWMNRAMHAERELSELANENTNLRNDLVLAGMSREQVERELGVANANHRQMSKQMANLGRALAEAVEVLRPFEAVASDYIERGLDDDEIVIAGRIQKRPDDEKTPPRVTFAHIRAARQFVKEHEK